MRTIEPLSDEEYAELTDIMTALLKSGSIMKSKIDPLTKMQKNDPRYERLRVIENQVRVFLFAFGINLMHDSTYGIYYVKSDTAERSRLTKEQTYLLFILRLIYDEKMREANLEIKTTRKEIRDYGDKTGLITETIPETTWDSTLTFLKNKNIIVYPGAIRNLEDDTPIYITEMILIAMSLERMKRIEGAIING